MEVLPQRNEIPKAMDVLPETVQDPTASEREAAVRNARKLRAQLLALRQALINVLFLLITMYYLTYIILSMWPLFAGFVWLYYLKKEDINFKARDLFKVLVKVGKFVVYFSINLTAQIMRFVNTF